MKTLLTALLFGTAGFLFGTTGCATTQRINFAVTSVPDSVRVDVGGVQLGVTPLNIWLGCHRSGNGIYSERKYEVTAFPLPGSGGTTQTKLINPCLSRMSKENTIHFDLGLKPVAPIQNVNLKIDQKDSLEQAKLRRVRLLKRMLDEGLITKEEYNEKVDKILSE